MADTIKLPRDKLQAFYDAADAKLTALEDRYANDPDLIALRKTCCQGAADVNAHAESQGVRSMDGPGKGSPPPPGG